MSKKENKENSKNKLDALEKEFGLKKASSLKSVETIRTGIYALDYVLSNGIKLCEGGHKIEFSGRESSGKTSFALYIVKKYQELGKTCVWLVSESFHENWAKQLGVDTDKLLLAYPETVEDAGEKLLQFIPKFDLIVVDSVASLIPEAELERAINEPTRGGSAKAYSLICRKMYQILPNYQTTMIFINQIREKMGVCFTGDTRIKINYKGKSKRIDSFPIQVLSYNENTQKVERKRIIDFSKRNYKGFIYHININSSSGGNSTSFKATPEHPILTDKGWKTVETINKKDKILISYSDYFPLDNKDLISKLLACIIGDGNVRFYKHSAMFRLCHSKKQAEYLRVKSKLLNLKGKYIKYKDRVYFISENSYNIKQIAKEIYPNFIDENKAGKKELTKFLLNKINEEDFVYLYLDDGTLIQDERTKRIKVSICVKGLSKKSINALLDRFKTFGYSLNYCKSGNIIFNKIDSMKFLNKIKSFVPPCMQYKLPVCYRDFYIKNQSHKIENLYLTRFEKINQIIKIKVNNKKVYNLSVEDNNTYIVGGKQGAIVHNCYGNPETTPGGKALKHMYDTRIYFRAGKPIEIGTKEKKERIGIEINLFGKKNKLGVPQRKAVVDFYFTGKIDNKKSLLFAGLKYSIINLAGKTYTYNDKKAVGKQKFIDLLEDKDWKKIEKEIYSRIK